jgi:hypothetical protein
VQEEHAIMILVAGVGSRLRSETLSKPKCVVTVLGCVTHWWTDGLWPVCGRRKARGGS